KTWNWDTSPRQGLMIVVNLLINVDNPEDGTVVIVMAGEHAPMTAEERRLKLKSLLEN
uniref:Uncharacterized protein n=1 Tax=Amphimedon queenslandica TaxID=400682 RepID=A0A1X7T0N4_AMPQE